MNRPYIKSFNLSIWKSQSGFTAIELLIAIQLSLFVISIGYISYLFSIKLVNKWQEKVVTENSTAQISSTLTKAVDQIQEILIATDKMLLALDQDQDTVSISLDEGITYNSRNLGEGIFEFKHGRLKYYCYAENSFTIKPRLIKTHDPKKIKVIELDLIFERENKEYRCNIMGRLIRKSPKILKLLN